MALDAIQPVPYYPEEVLDKLHHPRRGHRLSDQELFKFFCIGRADSRKNYLSLDQEGIYDIIKDKSFNDLCQSNMFSSDMRSLVVTRHWPYDQNDPEDAYCGAAVSTMLYIMLAHRCHAEVLLYKLWLDSEGDDEARSLLMQYMPDYVMAKISLMEQERLSK